jgi:hypothetical protein
MEVRIGRTGEKLFNRAIRLEISIGGALPNNNVKNNPSLMLVFRTTLMTPAKPQISKFQADKILPSGLQRVKAALLVSVC